MKIFILEDNPERIKIFKKIFSVGNQLFIYTSIDEVKTNYFLNGPYELYYFDHDLGGKFYVDSNDENTGFQVAKWIINKDPEIMNKKIIIHSLNYYGALNIKSLFKKAFCIPFNILIDSYKDLSR